MAPGVNLSSSSSSSRLPTLLHYIQGVEISFAWLGPSDVIWDCSSHCFSRWVHSPLWLMNLTLIHELIISTSWYSSGSSLGLVAMHKHCGAVTYRLFGDEELIRSWGILLAVRIFLLRLLRQETWSRPICVSSLELAHCSSWILAAAADAATSKKTTQDVSWNNIIGLKE